MGEDEKAQGIVQIKDMDAGRQQQRGPSRTATNGWPGDQASARSSVSDYWSMNLKSLLADDCMLTARGIVTAHVGRMPEWRTQV